MMIFGRRAARQAREVADAEDIEVLKHEAYRLSKETEALSSDLVERTARLRTVLEVIQRQEEIRQQEELRDGS